LGPSVAFTASVRNASGSYTNANTTAAASITLTLGGSAAHGEVWSVTISEAGVPGFHSAAVLGMLAPARTPRAIIDTLNAESHKVMKQPATVETMRRVAVDIELSTPEEFGRLIDSELQRWSKVIRALKLKPL